MTETDVEERDDEKERWIEPEPGWGRGEEEELPPRPRSRFLAPLPIALIAILIAAAGFLGGVLVQKGSGEGSAAAAIPGGGLPTVARGGSSNAVTGTVTGVKGRTIYVKEAAGNVVAVKAEDGSAVSRDSNVGVKKIHPGDSVVVQGAKHGSTVKASSISATEAGVESSATSGFPALGEGEGEGGGSSVESLFGE